MTAAPFCLAEGMRQIERDMSPIGVQAATASSSDPSKGNAMGKGKAICANAAHDSVLDLAAKWKDVSQQAA